MPGSIGDGSLAEPETASLTPYYMALRSSLQAPNSSTLARIERRDAGQFGLVWAGFLTLVVASPWVLPGYIFGTDFPGPRHFALPNAPDSSAPLQAVMAASAWAVGGEATGKLLVLGLLFAAGLFAYRAVPQAGVVPRAAAATLYVVNPFVYGRLHYGQMYLLVGYAILPIALSRLMSLLAEPGAKSSLGAAAAVVLVGIASPHLFLIAGFTAVMLYATHFVARNRRLDYLKTSVPWVLLAIVIAAIASSYWAIPLIAGGGYGGAVIGNSGSAQLNAFAAVPDKSLGLLPNLAGLYGFWAEDSGRFTSMKAFVPFWPVILAAILAVAGLGVASAFRREYRQLAPWVAGLVIVAAVALVLEMGISNPATAGLVRWLDAHLVVYRGLRDAGKWTALLALVYSQLVGLGAVAVVDLLRARVRGVTGREWGVGITAGLLLALPLYYGNGLLFGAHGEIKPSPYPAGWYAADRLLTADNHPGRALMLPWHEYMSYGFIQNQNRVVAPPAPSFFSVPVLVSANPDVAGMAAPTNPDQVAISSLVSAGSKGDWAQVLAAHGVKYVLLARELDWRSYTFLESQSGLTKVGDFDSIVVFRNSFSP